MLDIDILKETHKGRPFDMGGVRRVRAALHKVSKIPGDTPIIRCDNGLVFQSRRFRAVPKDYRLEQEFVTLNTPEQNPLIESIFRSLKEECVW